MPRRLKLHDKPLTGYSFLDGEQVYLPFSDRIVAIPGAHRAQAAAVAEAMHTVECGVTVGTLKGSSLIPAQQLALARALRRDAFPVYEISDTGLALQYLRREAVSLPSGAPRGHVLLAYGGLPLGFVNNLGNRANNLYPARWRILSR